MMSTGLLLVLISVMSCPAGPPPPCQSNGRSDRRKKLVLDTTGWRGHCLVGGNLGAILGAIEEGGGHLFCYCPVRLRFCG